MITPGDLQYCDQQGTPTYSTPASIEDRERDGAVQKTLGLLKHQLEDLATYDDLALVKATYMGSLKQQGTDWILRIQVPYTGGPPASRGRTGQSSASGSKRHNSACGSGSGRASRAFSDVVRLNVLKTGNVLQ